MARRKLPRAFMDAVSDFVLDPGEIVFDQDNDIVRFGDGITPGGRIFLPADAIGIAATDENMGTTAGDGRKCRTHAIARFSVPV